MEIVYLLVGISVAIVTGVIGLFIWAVNHHQFDDLHGPGFRVVADDDRPSSEER
jgi:cbb3-type cytochrome oxidase maturation protein